MTIPDLVSHISKKFPRARFDRGTIVLEDVEGDRLAPEPFRWHEGKWRCPACHYESIRPWLKAEGIRDRVPEWQRLPSLRIRNAPRAHSYQTQALKAWTAADRRGSVILPTGAGKTFLAFLAMRNTKVSTLVVVPTIDLLHQWYACLENAFGDRAGPVGVWYGLEKKARPLTVTTYHSAWANAEELGNRFKLLVFDEIHHLPAPSWHEIALMCAAPFRLGLTATYPDQKHMREPPPQSDRIGETQASYGSPDPGKIRDARKSYGSQRVSSSGLLEEIVGPVVYRKEIDELTGKQLAEYRTQRIRVDLSREEREAYDEAHETYMGYVRDARLRGRYGPGWWEELTRRSAYDPDARRAKVAELGMKDIVHQARGKLEVLDQLLREHRNRQMLVFTAHNRFAYRISRKHFIPAITHQTKAAERKDILDKFRDGAYRAVVTSRVLNEGVDVPEAKIAVVLGGTAGAREYIQRLGRVLRKQGNTQAVLYEVIVRKTVDEGIAQRRRRG